MEFLQNHLDEIISLMKELRILGAVIIMVLFVVLSKLADIFIERVVKIIVDKSRITIDDNIVEIIHKPVLNSMLLLGAICAVRWINLDTKTTFILTALLKTALILVAEFCLNKLLKEVCVQWCSVRRQGIEVINLFENLGRIVLLTGGLALFFVFWQIDITPLLASAGIAGIAIAFAAKESLANFFGGVNIFLDRPFKIGDYIILETGERGEVVDIGVRSTRILTRDDIQVSIPNSIIANNKIINESAPEQRFRIRIKIGVAYGSDIDLVENVLLNVADSNESLAKTPKPRVRFRAFGDSSLDFELLCWAKTPSDKGLVIHELNRAVYKEFDRNNITIPFPQRDINIQTCPECIKKH